MRELTRRQQKVLSAVAGFDRENGFPPTLAELGELVGLPNVNAVRGHLSALEKKGYITRVPDKARSIRIVREPSTYSRLKRRLHEVLRTDEGMVHHVVYALAWTTQARRPPLDDALRKRLTAAFEREAIEHGWELTDLKVEHDHVALVVRVWPNHSPDLAVRRLKSAGAAVTGRRPWARGFAVTTDPALLDELVEELRQTGADQTAGGGR